MGLPRPRASKLGTNTFKTAEFQYLRHDSNHDDFCDRRCSNHTNNDNIKDNNYFRALSNSKKRLQRGIYYLQNK